MTIEINKPELEDLIRKRLESGTFQNVEDVLWQALSSAPPQEKSDATLRPRPEGQKSLAQLFADSPFRGLAMDFDRFPDILPPG